MSAELFADVVDGRLHAAVVRRGALDDLYTDAPGIAGVRWGAVYLGRIVKVDTRLEAALVDLGSGAQGLLPLREGMAAGQTVCAAVRSEGKRGSENENQKLPRLRLLDGDAAAPAPSALLRALGDYGAEAFEHIHVGSREIFAQIPAPLAETKRVRLFRSEKAGQKLFDTHDLYGALEQLKDGRVALPGGGSLAIEQAAAFTVIDVNQGSAASAAEVNVAAAREAARQCRVRDLSGAILVDFIGTARTRVLEALTEAVAVDPAGPQVHGFTRLGIMEITRPRRSAPYAEKLVDTGV